jgi:hypothetical protein
LKTTQNREQKRSNSRNSFEKNVFAIKKNILMIEEIWIKVFRWRSFPPLYKIGRK